MSRRLKAFIPFGLLAIAWIGCNGIGATAHARFHRDPRVELQSSRSALRVLRPAVPRDSCRRIGDGGRLLLTERHFLGILGRKLKRHGLVCGQDQPLKNACQSMV
jgi:hypothetical protein